MPPGTYLRSPEVRERNRLNAKPGVPCDDDCTCGRHRSQAGKAMRKCDPGCACGKHVRTLEHNKRIGRMVKLTMEAKKRQSSRGDR